MGRSLLICALICMLYASTTCLLEKATGDNGGVIGLVTSKVFDNNDSEGFFCYKIPSITSTHNNTLLATAEARVDSCSDFAETHLVLKKSYDGGMTWSKIQTIYFEQKTVIGQASPVQLKSGRVILPFNRNNKDSLMTFSDDFGETWSKPRELEGVTKPHWDWIGFGPPGSVQLESGRILVPSYHGSHVPILNSIFYGMFTYGYMMISDDNGETWRLNKDQNFANEFPLFTKEGWKKFPPAIWPLMPNESQAVDLGNNKVLVVSRNFLGFRRIQTYSYDGGETFGKKEIANILAPVAGCEGSIFYSKKTKTLYYIGPSSETLLYRRDMHLFESQDEGKTWHSKYQFTKNEMAGYSALTEYKGKLVGIIEEASGYQIIMKPDKFTFVNFDIDV